jgi:hypothetical protein
VKLTFSSKVPSECRDALEELLFFNPRQHRVRDGIINSLEEFGHPRLEQTAADLAIRVGNHEAQSLFAYDQDRRSKDPVGVVVFLRTAPTDVAIIHVAVHPDYALRGQEAGVGLGVTLVQKVKEIAARIVGVKRIVFFYRSEVVMRV